MPFGSSLVREKGRMGQREKSSCNAVLMKCRLFWGWDDPSELSQLEVRGLGFPTICRQISASWGRGVTLGNARRGLTSDGYGCLWATLLAAGVVCPSFLKGI